MHCECLDGNCTFAQLRRRISLLHVNWQRAAQIHIVALHLNGVFVVVLQFHLYMWLKGDLISHDCVSTLIFYVIDKTASQSW
ncbi:hypothetical protein D918_04398 [Trichuris suis]|nr:hypothetical protein D918_04398 [Trichuris suis]